MTTKLRALCAVADWMGTYEAGNQGNLQEAVHEDDTEGLAEYPEDMVAGYQLILTQIKAEARSIAIREVTKGAVKSNPTLDPKMIAKKVIELVDAKIAEAPKSLFGI